MVIVGILFNGHRSTTRVGLIIVKSIMGYNDYMQ
jgi:hypothetical protein